MERTNNVTIIFTNKSTYFLPYDEFHSKTHTTIIPLSILFKILASPAKIRKNKRF